MKKQNKIISIVIILFLIVGIFTVIHVKSKRDYDNIKYGKPEFVSSMKDINKKLPTIILFKSSLVENSVKAEVNLKLLHDEYGDKFNIVHANPDVLDNKEAIELSKKYEVMRVPTLVALDKDGNFVEKKSNIYSKEQIEEMLKKIGVI